MLLQCVYLIGLVHLDHQVVHIFAHFGAKVYLNSTDFPMKKKATTPSLRSATTKQAHQAIVQSPQKAQPLLVEIGSRLRHARFSKGLLIKDLAERVGVSISLISKYENNKILQPLTVLHSVVTELGTNIGALLEPNWTGVDYVARANG